LQSVAPTTETDAAPAAQQVTQMHSVPTPTVAENWSPAKNNFARRATSSAETIDLYGLVIQIVGLVTGGIVFLYFTFIWGPASDLRFLGFIGGIIIGALTALGYIVLGALYRMTANYVLFRTSK
jgi:sensor domain CHASE-containing protein